MAQRNDLSVKVITCRPGLVTEMQPRPRFASFAAKAAIAVGLASMSPKNRTSPFRPSSAKATEVFNFDTSNPTKTSLCSFMARPR